MDFEWKMEKGKEPTFDEKIQNLACFEVVLNILRMKTKAGESDISMEMQALCGFALECMFKDIDLDDEDLFKNIMDLKDKKVYGFKTSMLKDMGIPQEVAESHEIGEA